MLNVSHNTLALLFIACLGLAIAGAIFAYRRFIKAASAPFEMPIDLRHYPSSSECRWSAPLACVLCLVIIGITSWAALRDETARREERAAAVAQARKLASAPMTIKIRNHVVEIEHGNCLGFANTRKGTTYQYCAD